VAAIAAELSIVGTGTDRPKVIIFFPLRMRVRAFRPFPVSSPAAHRSA
jgi:hypothetical protein